jgi:spore germination cell wall hydrolase CwlJ-like protein
VTSEIEKWLLKLTVWREARGASPECQAAVTYSILNRAAHPAWWGKSLYDVITAKWQYSSIAAPGDLQLWMYPKLTDPSFIAVCRIVDNAISGNIPNPAPGADSYFDQSIAPPKWATDNKLVAHIGRIKFYNLDGK